MSTRSEKMEAFGRILDIMDELREKCPWDREQTMESLRNLTIEETYELADAIIEKDMDEIRTELGDLLLHIVFYAKIGDEKSVFDITDVINTVSEKLIFRHPHVFGEREVTGSKEVISNWEELKMKENNGTKRVLSGVPKTLPALIKAHRVQDKARAVGFDWASPDDIWEKVSEEVGEVRSELRSGSREQLESEFGDLLFSIVNAARLYDIEPETALERANLKFMHRFNYIEEHARANGRNINALTLEEMDALWEEAKQKENN
ncbi:MAG: nucleoside triphosphate pyrophosphohydrolase [Bacteroidales bacterium]|nr:nucleoside triphosphate pyrophosphohydrolase [Bacteroidales bacterium]MDT8430509.1 nucleoside triphosphate pyrophosphohydrolase [Bacteroidales bacterium]